MQVITKVLDLDEGYRLAKDVRLSVGPKEVTAPRRALSASRGPYHNETKLENYTVRGLIEVYRHLSHEKLLKMITQTSETAKFSYEISSSLSNVNLDKEITIGILEYHSNGVIPNSQETEFLLDILNNPYFDIVVPPIIPKLTRENYTKFLEEFIDVYNSSTFFPVLSSYIPHYSSIDIPYLFKYYAKKDPFGKDFICVDFNGSNPISQYMFVSMIVREARDLEKETGHSIFLHALNLKYGKATRKQFIVPAKDLLIYTMGFNSFGANHKILPIAGNIGAYELRMKLLNRADYGYYSWSIADEIAEKSGTYEIKLGDVLSDKKMAKFFNAERQGCEAAKISEVIKEHELKTYIESKAQVKNQKILKIIKKVHDKAMQTKL